MEQEFKADFLDCVDLDTTSKLVTVLVYEVERSWFRRKINKTERKFTYVGGVWLDECNNQVLDYNVYHRLQEMLVARIANSGLETYIATL